MPVQLSYWFRVWHLIRLCDTVPHPLLYFLVQLITHAGSLVLSVLLFVKLLVVKLDMFNVHFVGVLLLWHDSGCVAVSRRILLFFLVDHIAYVDILVLVWRVPRLLGYAHLVELLFHVDLVFAALFLHQRPDHILVFRKRIVFSELRLQFLDRLLA